MFHGILPDEVLNIYGSFHVYIGFLCWYGKKMVIGVVSCLKYGFYFGMRKMVYVVALIHGYIWLVFSYEKKMVKTDDNGNAMFQSYLSKLFKKEIG